MTELRAYKKDLFKLWRAYRIQGGHEMTERILLESLNLVTLLEAMPPKWFEAAQSPTERI